MGGTAARALWRLRICAALAWTLLLYWLVVFPQARRELRRWQQRAQRIPEPRLRAHALSKLHSEGMTAEGAAAFAILATARSCRHVVRACVAFEVVYDYIDALAEEPVADVLGTNRQLYGALGAAFRRDALDGGPVPLAFGDDGGYLQALVDRCRDALLHLPAYECVRTGLSRLAVRAAESQSLHHAADNPLAEAALARWAIAQQPPGSTLLWWELAAAAGSPLGFFALIAAAAHRDTDLAAAHAVEQAYFPWIAALSWLLESLVDQEEDAGSAAHSYIAHYGPAQTAARRLATIAEHAMADARRLPQGGRHALLLAGMAAMYLSHAAASGVAAREGAAAVRRAIGGPLVPLLWVLRARRRLA